MNILILNIFGHKNLGDAMLVESLVQLIRESDPNISITGVAFDVETQKKFMPDVAWVERLAGAKGGHKLVRRFMQAYVLAILCVIAFFPRLKFIYKILPKGQKEFFDALLRSDLAISCPGGYLEDSNYAYYINLLQIKIPQIFGVKTILAPQSIGPIESEFGRKMLIEAISSCHAIFVREDYSYEFAVKELARSAPLSVVNTKVFKSGDLAFWYNSSGPLKETSKSIESISGKRVGITLLKWSFPRGGNPEELERKYIDAMNWMIDDLIFHGYSVVIVNQVADDAAYINENFKERPGMVFDLSERSPKEILDVIASVDLMIASRFHSCIFAMLTSKPVVSIAYLPKSVEIMSDLGLSNFVINIEDINRENIKNIFFEVSSHAEEISKEMTERIESYKINNSGFNSYIRELLRV